MLAGIVRRITKIEKQIDKAAREIRAKDCNCFQDVCAISDRLAVHAIRGGMAEFEAEMNKTCPVHGFRRLSHPVVILDDGADDPDRPRIDELIDRYERRYEEYERREQKRKDIIRTGVLRSASKKKQLVL